MITCWHCKAESPPAHYDRVVHNVTALHGAWVGWRMAGRFLIGPGVRITPERLRGWLWTEASGIRRPIKHLDAPARSSIAFLRPPDDAA